MLGELFAIVCVLRGFGEVLIPELFGFEGFFLEVFGEEGLERIGVGGVYGAYEG